MVRIFFLGMMLALLLGMSGCTTAAIAVIDEKISQMTDQDCTTVNLMLGDSYCKDNKVRITQAPLYCYRTLGGVDCYGDKDPYAMAGTERAASTSELGSTGVSVARTEPSVRSAGTTVRWPGLSAQTETAELD
jgi:hypothetical protein